MRAALLLVLASACSGAPTTEHGSTNVDPRRRPLTMTYLGVAGWMIQSGDVTILVDPYFSRPNLDGEIVSDPKAVAAHAPANANLIVVGHSHVDHLLDTPAVALATGAFVMGSESTVRVAKAAGVPDARLVTVKGGEELARDGFSVRAIPSLHSKLDDDDLLHGSITVVPPKTIGDYQDGGTFNYLVRVGGRQILVSSTANFIEQELVGVHPDIAIVATGLRERVDDYTCRLMRVLGNPQVVYTTHFDNWRGAPVDEEPDDDLKAFVDEVKRCSPSTQVVIPKHFVRMTVP